MLFKQQMALSLVLAIVVLSSVAQGSRNPVTSRGLMGEYNAPPYEFDVDSPLCGVNEQGFYGSESSTRDIVEFNYQLETEPIDSATLKGEVLDALERDILIKVLPSLFMDECMRRRQLRRKLTDNVYGATGASTAPGHTPIEDLTCSVAYNEANQCTVIDAKFTVFTDGSSSGQDYSNILFMIEQWMNQGDFNDAHPDIVNATFFNLSPDALTDGNTSDGPTIQIQGGQQQRRGPYYAAIAGVVVVLVGAAIIWRKRRRDEDASVLTDPTLQEGNVASSEMLQQDLQTSENGAALDFNPINETTPPDDTAPTDETVDN